MMKTNKNKLAIKLIQKYQQNKDHTNARCLHYPTCSVYAIGCYEKFNFFKASFYVTKRIISCNPISKKTYDPIPLNKEEKEIEKNYKALAKKLNEILLTHQKKYKGMLLSDYIKLIYQSTLGPYHLQEVSKDDVLNYLNKELKDVESDSFIEEIGNNFIRVYLGNNLDKDLLITNFIASMVKPKDEDFILFRYRLLDLKDKIKKKKILLDKKVLKDLDNYLIYNFGPVSHSDTYKAKYHPHYRVIKKQAND